MTVDNEKITNDPIAYTEWNEVATAANKVTNQTLTAADISDFDTEVSNNTTVTGKLTDIVDDTAPQLGGDLDCNDNHITQAETVSFEAEYDNGSKSANFSVDFINGQKQRVELTENTITMTFDTTTIGVGNYLLKIVNGGLATLTWEAETGSVYFPGGTAPTLTSSGTDFAAIYFDGTNFWVETRTDFS